MEPFTISFFGHRRIENLVSVESKLIRIVRDLLKSKAYVEFLVGRNGDFDQLVSSVVIRAKREYRADNSSLVLVLPYVTAECRDNEESFLEYYDEVEICEESAFAHFKSAIRLRNCSMIEKSDLVVCYVEHSSGGAYQAMKYAKKHHKQVYNLCVLDERGEAVFIDSTHIKANANPKKAVKAQIPDASRHYAQELMEEVNADREAHGKKPFEDDDENEPPAARKKHRDNTSKKKQARRKKEKSRTVTKSVTDPDCGLFVKGNHKRQFAYEAHTACDKHGFVLEAVVTAGNVHDSAAFDEVYDKVTERFAEVETVVADSAYKTPHICKKVFQDKRVLSTAYKRPQTMKGGHEWWKYVYDEFYDCVICPEYQSLHYSTTNRDGYREYKSDAHICANCPTRELCTHSKDFVKTVQRHIWKDYEDLADDARYTPKYRDLYKQRKETIERVFADAKEKHAMRYTQYRGLAQVTNWVKLKFAAMNLKRLANWKWKNTHSRLYERIFSTMLMKYPVAA